MPVAPSFDDLLTQYEAEAQARSDLLFLEGDVSLAQAHGSGAMADASIRFSAQAFKETFIDGAKGAALTALVSDHLGIERQTATAATTPVKFTRTSGGGGGTIPAGTTVGTSTLTDGSRVTYTTDADIIVGAGLNGPFTIGATAVDAGRAGNVDAATLTQIVDAVFDSTFTVTNDAAAAGGNEEESDDELRRRARTFWTALRRGTLAALEFGALEVPAVRSAIAVEDSTTGIVTVLVTDIDGNSNLEMIDDVTTELENWRAAGSVVEVSGGTKVVYDVNVVLTLADGVDLVTLSPLVLDAVPARANKLRTGETLYEDMLTAAVVAIDPDGILAVRFEFTGVTPDAGGNVVPAATAILRCNTVTTEEE